MGIKLSIAIPTYNRAVSIREALDSIVSQLEDGVEIVISDNASTDETADIVDEYQSKYPVIRYFCNDENLGGDRNCDLAVQRSGGEYVWLFGDDDKIAPGGISKILTVLKLHRNLALVFVNWRRYTADFEQCLSERALDISEDIFCPTANDFFRVTKKLAYYLSSCVVRRSLWTNTDVSRFIGTCWMHYVVKLSLLQGHSAYCVAGSYVMFRSGVPCREESTCLKFRVELARVLRELPQMGYEETITQEILRTMSHELPYDVMSFKRAGLVATTDLVKDLIGNFGSYLSFWFFAFPLVLLPQWVHRFARRIYDIPLVKRIYKKTRSWIWQI